ncbi:MAG: pyrroloquinoline quinone biosynthesis peptide chaperone PqqD [Pseudohongiellaceae bacterium]|nr:pyrroloquinoline quinone biosynthesis peptide chaperone PqqD [Pseudohongiellaceae bacterium]
MSLAKNKAISLHRQFKFQWEPAQEKYVLLYPEGLVKLDESAGHILKRVNGKNSVEDIIKDLEQAFPGADLRQDVIVFLEHAHEKGWIDVE